MDQAGPPRAHDQAARMEQYYRVHAAIYDATRWSFLFGRGAIVQYIAQAITPTTILEIGCGTGHNLLTLHRAFPAATLVGIDAAPSMIARAQRRLGTNIKHVVLVPQVYDQPLRPQRPFDVVLCSYSLTMINPGWDAVITHAVADLRPGGVLAVVDFHDSPVQAFKRWMGVNHVRMDGHLLPVLAAHVIPQRQEVRAAYGGLWRYLSFIGTKDAPA
jgi:S-adenosylmethionine-diacylgycerolhomoserine-N-methlytransferase